LAKIPGVRIAGVATRSGLTARGAAEKFAAEVATSDADSLIAAKDIDAVLIATRHDTHASLVASALAHGKHVFVEKPLALDAAGLIRVVEAHAAAGDAAAPVLLTGFNRRFSTLARRLCECVAGKPLVMTYRVNAGTIAATSWVQDAQAGGGRIVGEVCHFVDIMQFLAGAPVIEVFARSATGREQNAADPDKLAIQLSFADGSVGTITYASDGSPDFAKERLEVFGGGIAGIIDNWRKLTVRGPGLRVDESRWFATAKGHAEEMAAFVQAVREGTTPIAFADQVNTTRATFAIQESLRSGMAVAVPAAADITR
jgi:predicted dehydrogenase